MYCLGYLTNDPVQWLQWVGGENASSLHQLKEFAQKLQPKQLQVKLNYNERNLDSEILLSLKVY